MYNYKVNCYYCYFFKKGNTPEKMKFSIQDYFIFCAVQLLDKSRKIYVKYCWNFIKKGSLMYSSRIFVYMTMNIFPKVFKLIELSSSYCFPGLDCISGSLHYVAKLQLQLKQSTLHLETFGYWRCSYYNWNFLKNIQQVV